MSKKKLGLELEMHLLDSDGNVTNMAPVVINDKDNNGNIIKECSQSVVEVIAPPSSNLNELAELFTTEVKNLANIAAKYNLRLMPSTTIGSDSSHIQGNESPRYASKKAVLGIDKRSLEYHICGTHVHVDKLDRDKQTAQYLAMTAMDPIFSLMASSPFFSGNNSLEDHRVHIYRNVVFEELPLQGTLLPYPEDIEEAESRQLNTYTQWLEMVKARGFDGDGFTNLNTCWGPVKLAERTIESRGTDANLLTNVFALAAVYKGINEIIDKENPQIKFANQDTTPDKLFKLENGVLLLPTYEQLKKFENLGIHQGIKNNEVRQYLGNIVNLARNNLELNEQKYLVPFQESLRTSRSFSADIVNYAKGEGIYQIENLPNDSARQIRNYIANEMHRDLEKIK